MMFFRFSPCALLVLCACLSLSLIATDDIELHRLFKAYNKPAVKVIKTIHGDKYSCVDFYKQPAFDNPLLKNYSYRPEMDVSQLHEQPTNVSKESSSIFKKLWQNGEGCPIGTVPIRKYTKDQFIRTHKLFQKLYASPSDDPVPGRFRASVHTKDGPHTFYGSSGTLSVYNYVIDKSQYTAGYIMLRAVNDQIQFGWMINPTLYGDGLSRLFLSTTVEKNKCFNLMCNGYVHTNNEIPIEAVLTPTTVRGTANSYEMLATIIKDPNRWRLSVLDSFLGYWPNEAFKGLSGPAEYLEWGGETYNPNGLKGPGMGSGFFPVSRPQDDGYVRQIKKYDQALKASTLENSETESYADNRDLYKVSDGGNVDVDRGHIVYYGGPGK